MVSARDRDAGDRAAACQQGLSAAGAVSADELHVDGVWSDEDVELFLAPLRNPVRVASYRDFIVPLFQRVIAGRYRSSRLRTPTLILYGSQDPNMRPEILGGYEDLADDLVLECVEGASHFIADEKPDVAIDRVTQFFARQ